MLPPLSTFPFLPFSPKLAARTHRQAVQCRSEPPQAHGRYVGGRGRRVKRTHALPLALPLCDGGGGEGRQAVKQVRLHEGDLRVGEGERVGKGEGRREVPTPDL